MYMCILNACIYQNENIIDFHGTHFKLIILSCTDRSAHRPDDHVFKIHVQVNSSLTDKCD